VPVQLLADPDAKLGTPAELFVIPDHYVIRMLYSQGVKIEAMGIPAQDGTPVETDHRTIWRRFAENFFLFQGTPTGLWLKDELINVFGIHDRLEGDNADRIYDALEEKLRSPEFTPRALFERFNIELLCTTDKATDELEAHRSLHEEGWECILPTFRPDAVVNLGTESWRTNVERLGELAGIQVDSYDSFISAIENRRAFFKEMGATATDHAALTPCTRRLSDADASAVFERALRERADAADAECFTAHMLMEMARMSTEDGLAMQLHVGSFRNHNRRVFRRFGPDRGGDIPLQTEWTRSLYELLNAYGDDPNFRLILFTLDEATYGRELAPLAGHYPAVVLGPPWWFFDSVLGMERFLDAVVETAGFYNLAGFNDDTRAFPSIPARHDVWRRVMCNWLAGLVTRGLMDEEAAPKVAADLAYHLAKSVYKLPEETSRGTA
jgi:glucuronate isomerase